MHCLIRTATEKDRKAIVRLKGRLADFHAVTDDFYKPGKLVKKSFKKYLKKLYRNPDARILVAEKDGKIIAYFIGMINEAKPYAAVEKTGRISDAFVLKKYRGRGLGRKMFDELMAWFREQGLEYAELSVDARNGLGMIAWLSYGFEPFMIKMKRKL